MTQKKMKSGAAKRALQLAQSTATATTIENADGRLLVALFMGEEACTETPYWWPAFLDAAKRGDLKAAALWAPSNSVVTALKQRYFAEAEVPTYAGYDARGGQGLNGGLDELCQIQNLYAGIVNLHPEEHAAVVRSLLSNPSFHMHLLSTGLPTSKAADYMQLISLHADTSHSRVERLLTSRAGQSTKSGEVAGPSQSDSEACLVTAEDQGFIWSVAEPMRYEAALNMVAARLPDIGDLIGGHLDGTALPGMAVWRRGRNLSTSGSFTRPQVDHASSTSSSGRVATAPSPEDEDAAFHLGVLTSYVAVWRRFFGVLKSVSSARRCLGGLKTWAGAMTFQSGATCTFCITPKSDLPRFEMRLWGTRGALEVTYSASKDFFEVQRVMHHFENPTCHKPTGIEWSLLGWLEAISYNKIDGSSAAQSLHDMTIATSIYFTGGGLMSFRPAVIRPADPASKPCAASATKTVSEVADASSSSTVIV